MPNDCITIDLGRGYTTLIDECDADLQEFKWYALVLKKSNKVYAFSVHYTPERKLYLYLHRVILARILERPIIRAELCDHQDNNGLNNVRSNLRLADKSRNAMNGQVRSDNTSGFKGVTWHKGAAKWMAQIHLNGEHIHLGLHDTAELAYAAYCVAARKHFGEFARLD